MINCIVIDDDPIALNLVKHFVTNTDGLNLLQVFGSAIEAANYVRQNQGNIDLVFLDIEMPEMSGLQLLESYRDLPPVILISSKEKYALKAFEYKVLHYLLKPIEYSGFLKAIERAFQLYEGDKLQQPLDYLFVKENGVLNRLHYKDIYYFEALGDYVKVHVKDKAYVVNSSMKSLEDKLKANQHFVRIHRSYVINLNYLENFDSETAIVSRKPIAIGNKYRTGLQNRLTII
ncbi:MAG TPA: LytTR family DNA-binding domain-containing protein [Chitinophagales bacterium]|nr:LytTR family DNA-binding domain-containing protein [Chitinophagales bacterium]